MLPYGFSRQEAIVAHLAEYRGEQEIIEVGGLGKIILKGRSVY